MSHRHGAERHGGGRRNQRPTRPVGCKIGSATRQHQAGEHHRRKTDTPSAMPRSPRISVGTTSASVQRIDKLKDFGRCKLTVPETISWNSVHLFHFGKPSCFTASAGPYCPRDCTRGFSKRLALTAESRQRRGLGEVRSLFSFVQVCSAGASRGL